MKLSSKTITAIKMFIDLGEHYDEGYISLVDIANRKELSKKFLEQIVPIYKANGLLLGTRGNQGGYALIYKIQSVTDNKFYALKKITIQSSSHKKQIKREIKIWKDLSKYSNIVELIDFQWGERHAYIIMELCEEGTLLDYVNNYEGNIPELEALQIFNQILLGVNAMHSQNPPIAHRDLKIENILKKKEKL